MGFFSRLVSGLKNTKKSFSEKLKFVFTGNEIDESFFEELEFILISSDLGTSTTEDILDELRNQVKQQKLKKTDECKEVLKDILKNILNANDIEEFSYPLAIMVVGVVLSIVSCVNYTVKAIKVLSAKPEEKAEETAEK